MQIQLYTSLQHTLFYSKPVLPIQLETHDNEDEVLSLKCGDEDNYGKQMNQLKSKIFQKAKENINDAQLKQKQYYDNKRGRRKVLYIMVKNKAKKFVV